MEGTPYNIGICGSYGGMNLGDEAILTVIARELRARLPVSLTVFSREPLHTMGHHRMVRVVGVRECSRARLLEEMRGLDLLILGGGGILFDGEAGEFVRPALLAHELEVPVATWAIGVGPLRDPAEQAKVLQALGPAALVTVRDAPSQRLLEQIGLTREVVVTADPGHLLPPERFSDRMLAEEGIAADAPLIGISLRAAGPAAPKIDRRLHELIATAADYLIERLDATVLFIPMERADLRDSHALASSLANPRRARFLTGDYSAGQVRGLVEHLTLGIGVRLHFLLFAAAAGVPWVTLRYGSKVGALADILGLPALPVLTTTGELLAAIDRTWYQRDALSRQAHERSQELAQQAARTGALIAALLDPGAGDEPSERRDTRWFLSDARTS